MSAPAPPRRVLVLALVAACGAGASAATNDANGPPRQEPLHAGDEAGDDDAQPWATGPSPRGGGCLAPNERTFVALSRGMTLGDFDMAALESRKVMIAVRQGLCGRARALDQSGALLADLSAHRLTMFEVAFVRDDASAADVGLRRVDLEGGGPRGDYRLATERTERGWQLVRVSRP